MKYEIKQTTRGKFGYLNHSNVEVRVNGAFHEALSASGRYTVECYIKNTLDRVLDCNFEIHVVFKEDYSFTVEFEFTIEGLVPQKKEFDLKEIEEITDYSVANQTAIVLDLCCKIDKFYNDLINADSTSTIVLKGGIDY